MTLDISLDHTFPGQHCNQLQRVEHAAIDKAVGTFMNASRAIPPEVPQVRLKLLATKTTSSVRSTANSSSGGEDQGMKVDEHKRGL